MKKLVSLLLVVGLIFGSLSLTFADTCTTANGQTIDCPDGNPGPGIVPDNPPDDLILFWFLYLSLPFNPIGM